MSIEKIKNTGINVEMVHRDGEVVLFVHTILGNMLHWDFYFQHMNHSLLRYDLRGHGKSDIPDGNYTIDVFCKDLNDIIQKYHLKKVVLIGHSVGAIIILQYLDRYGPKNIHKIVLISGSLCLKYPTHSDDIEALHDINEVNQFYASFFCSKKYPKVTQRLIQDWLSIHPLTYRRLNILKPNFPNFNTDSFRYDIPALILYGQKDKLISKSEKQNMKKVFPHHQYHKINNAGHFLILEEPKKVLKKINDFLDGEY